MLDIRHEAKGLVAHGVSTCAGCGLEIAFRSVINTIGEDVIVVIPPGCAALFSGFGNETVVKIPGYQGNLENTAASASGIRAALTAKGNTHTTVLAFAGDGATVDIGLQSLSGTFERGDKVLYICYDNEAYMNTGIQGSSSTPFGASTTTTPAGKRAERKNLAQIAIAHNIPYVATASVAYLEDLKKKVEKAKNTDGPSLLHIYAPCPTGWRSNPAKTVEISRLAVQTGAWMLYEYDCGVVTFQNLPAELKSIEEYFNLQGRFKHLTEEQKADIQDRITASYARTKKYLEALNG